MGLPSRLTNLIGKIRTGTDVEKKLVGLLVKRLSHTLSTLQELFGSECEDCFRQLIGCILQTGDSACFDRYEGAVEAIIIRRRALTEQEEQLVGEVIGQVVSITEMLVDLAGVTLTEPVEDDDATGSAGAIGNR